MSRSRMAWRSTSHGRVDRAIVCLTLFGLAVVTGVRQVFAQPAGQSPQRSSDENAQARHWFEDAKFGLFIHWGVYSLLGQGRVGDGPRQAADLRVRQTPSAVQSDAVRRRCLGQAGQISRREIHHDHRQAPRRLLHVRQPVDRLRHRRRHALSRRPAQGAGRRLPSREDQAILLLLAARLAPPRLLSHG